MLERVGLNGTLQNGILFDFFFTDVSRSLFSRGIWFTFSILSLTKVAITLEQVSTV